MSGDLSNYVVLEAFSGMAVLSRLAQARGATVYNLDYDPSFGPTYCMDILDVEDLVLPRPVDIMWASPECKTFSPASMGHHWGGGKGAYAPKTRECEMGIIYAWMGVQAIRRFRPRYWFIENPIGVLKKLDFMQLDALESILGEKAYYHEIWQCRYHRKGMNGGYLAKPTSIWTNNPHWKPRPPCRNRHPDHEAARRGAKTGTQGLKGHADRSILPLELCDEVLDSCLVGLEGIA